MRLAAYEDSIYTRDAGGALTVHQAFPLFMFGCAGMVDHLVVLGRLDPAPGRSHFVVPAPGAFRALPHYDNAADLAAVARALPATARVFWRTLREVDTVWVNGPSPMAIVFALLALLRRRRVVLGVRQNTLAYARSRFPGSRAKVLVFAVMEHIWRALARLTAVATVGEEVGALYAGARRRHPLAVSFVTDADLTAPRPARGDGPTHVLSVGRLEAEKNPVMLADVLAALQAGGGDWRLTVVGEGPLEDELRERLRALGVADRADLRGFVAVDDGLMDLYRSADVLLHVSWTEGLPQVLLEAFSARLPVVATDVGGVAAVARGAALLVGPGDPQAAADAVRRLAGDPALQAGLVAAGLERAAGRTGDAERRRLLAFMVAR